MIRNIPEQFGIDIRNFTQEEKIGIGGYSDVYMAQYKKNGENFAAKVIKSILREDEKKKIEGEIKIMSIIDHPTIIKYFGYSLLDFNLLPNIVIFTELVKNGSLSKIIFKAKQSTLPENYDNTTRQIILIGISSGMRYLHHQGIMHCDLKSSNILLDDNYYPHIIDFGMAKYVNKSSDFDNSLICGTLPYMAPEIILGRKYSYKIDVYAFAMIMYEVICESDLYPNIDYNNSLTKEFKKHVAILNGRPKFKLGIKSSLKYLIQRCWSTKVNERPNFDEIYDKLTDPQYYLDNVDEKRIKEYIDIITKNDVFDYSKSDLIQKVRNLSKENENLKKQIDLLKENNEKLSNDNSRMKNILDGMTNNVTSVSTMIIKPPLNDEHLMNNSRFHHLKDKKENEAITKSNSKQFSSTLKEIKSERITTTDSLYEEKENLHSQKKQIQSPNKSEVSLNQPRKPVRNLNDDDVECSQKKQIKVTCQNKEKVNDQFFNSQNSIEKKNDNVKLPSLNKMNKSEPVTFNEFNSCSLQQQQQAINNKVNSMNHRSRNLSLIDLQTLLNSIIQFIDAPETPGYIEIQAARSQEDKIDSIDKSCQINILYKTTEILYYHHLLDKSEFKDLLKLFKDKVSIEIKYHSKIYNGIYETVSRMKHVFVNIFISGIKKTDNTFKGNIYIDSVRFDDSVTSIIDYAFKNCCSLSNVTIPPSVTSIGSGSFEGCESLESISIPSSIKFIDFSVFKNCVSLSNVSLPNSIKMIRDNAFYGCSSLKRISLPSFVSSIGDCVFFGCSSLESIEIPPSVTSIGKSAFAKCSLLKNVSVPSSVSSIGKGLFEGCTSLEKITIPSSIKNMNELNIKPQCNIILI